ncbi:hypothetical protein [uncultured Ferrimonas sp.]|uniref:hypothetical protein n=1 Tax=uncultured Ferrimonas sp. TaxID=432640 RepID=UPI00261D98CB|nr:hypothetical protein [uncultured Ferrimonas sp.]
MKVTSTKLTTQWLPLLTAGLCIITLITLFWAVDKQSYAKELQQQNQQLTQQLAQQQLTQQQLQQQVQLLRQQKQTLLQRLQRYGTQPTTETPE